ncbi:tRNA pseudouridine(55) synthase TruB [Thermosynechococcaceae cyanobacterium Okahandja]
MLGFLNLDKPAGYTSHDCIAQLRRQLGYRRIGHGGTLDPMATGVLPIAIGAATRLLPYLADTKIYIGTVRFGITTTTDDITGTVVASTAVPHLTLAAIEEVLPQFIGTIGQRPPAYSAIQVAGERLYKRARAGEAVTVPLRQVRIHQITILDWTTGDQPEVTLQVHCGSGTYIRALARDLGERLGVGGTLSGLRRIASGGLGIDESHALEEITPDNLPLISPQVVLTHLPWIALDAAQVTDWYHGRALQPSSDLPEHTLVGVTCGATQACLGIGLCNGTLLRPKVVLPPSSPP